MNSATTTTNNSIPTSKMQIGRLLGPLLAVGVYFLLPAAVPEVARRTAAAGALMAIFWITEAIPLSATSLIPLVIFPLLGVIDIEQAAAPFAQPVIFLFLGGFMLAMAVERCGLHRRAALSILQTVGGTPGRLLAGCMAATAFLSMWISNTATVVMMIPIASSLIELLPTHHSDSQTTDDPRRLELCLLLGVAYSASIGGFGTLVGTPPNALLVGSLEAIGESISFGRWMMFAVPLVVIYLALLWGLLYWFALPKKSLSTSIDRSLIDQQLRKLGPMSRAEWTVLSVFLATATLWIIREPLQDWGWLVEVFPAVGRIDDASISIAAAVALFLLPINRTGERALDWQTANRLPWGVLILIGGGMSLAAAMNASGLNTLMADRLLMLQNLPPVLLIAAVVAITIFLTEITSNTATIAALLPVLLGLGVLLNCGPVPLIIPATLAASCAFMLPVATAPNAVVYDTGRVPMHAMMRYGLWLNLVGIVLIPLFMYFFGCSILDCPLPGN